MEIKKLEDKLKEILLKEFKAEAADFSFSAPPAHLKADLSSNFALFAAKKIKKSPQETAQKIISLLPKGINAKLAGGFINFNLDNDFYLNFLKNYQKEDYFSIKENNGCRVNIEFVSANPTGPLHLASGSGASLGDSLSRILKKIGYDVKNEYYVNNVGNQVENLGLSLRARFFKQPVPENGYHGDYLIKMADNLPEEAGNWTDKEFSDFAVKANLESQKSDMKDFKVDFDEWFMESRLHKENLPQDTLKILKSKNMAYEKDGALWLGLADENVDDKDRVLVKSDGKNTYFLNDLAYHRNKFERGFNWLIDIWGADHHGYINRVKAGMSALGYREENLTILIHQLVSLKKDGETVKMSKRAGDFISLRSLMEDVGTDACRFFFTMRSPNTHLLFDIDLARKKSNENPVFYVQYVHARICSIFEKAKELNVAELKEDLSGYVFNEDERKLLMKNIYFEKTLLQCRKDLSPHHIPTFLIELAGIFHSFYDKHKVVDPSNPSSTAARLEILKAVKHTIKTGLALLGVSAPEKM